MEFIDIDESEFNAYQAEIAREWDRRHDLTKAAVILFDMLADALEPEVTDDAPEDEIAACDEEGVCDMCEGREYPLHLCSEHQGLNKH